MTQALLAPGFLDEVARKGDYLRLRLERLAARHGLGEVRGEGLLLALDLGSDLGPLLVERAREGGLLINSPRPRVLRFMPALNVSDAEIDTMVTRLDALFEDARVGAVKRIVGFTVLAAFSTWFAGSERGEMPRGCIDCRHLPRQGRISQSRRCHRAPGLSRGAGEKAGRSQPWEVLPRQTR